MNPSEIMAAIGGLGRVERDAALAALRMFAHQVAGMREPDVLIGGAERPYMRRWWLVPRNKYDFNLYLHHFLRSDDDRALHDHPWWNVSLLIDGEYIEHRPRYAQSPHGKTIRIHRKEGDIAFREATDCHRIELIQERMVNHRELPVWTIFATGPKVREWGFYCPKGWVDWQTFTGQDESNGPVRVGVVGAGCAETD